MLTDEDRKNILNEFLNNISRIADKNYQKRVWILGEGPECNDFTETICYFFEDVDGIIENYKEFKVSDDQFNLLIKFRNEFKKFSDANDFPELFINTLEWTKIIELAKEVLNAFNYKIKKTNSG